MDDILKRPYEISIWEDELVTGENGKTYYKENKIAVIGTDTMTAMNKVYEPVFKRNTNGEKTLTFSLRYQYFDPYVGATVINPFASFLINERKVKLHYDNEWHDFIIKEHVESSDGLIWTYTARDAFVNELSKNGYNIEFSADLNNNQGTAIELGQKTLENTDWKIHESSTVGPQRISEPIYKAVLKGGSNVSIINVTTKEPVTFSEDTAIYLFYTYVANQNGKFVQFILQNNSYTTDDNNCIIADNYRIENELTYEEGSFNFDGQEVISYNGIETKYQAYRMAYNQLTTYDPVMKRTVQRYSGSLLEDKEVYGYTDYVYTTSGVVTNFLTNGENFNIYENGTLQGWNSVADYEGDTKPEVNLTTYPKLDAETPLSPLNSFAQIEGFMEVKFPENFSNYKNGIFNSGFEDNASIIQSVSQGQEFVLRWRAAKSSERHGTLEALNQGDIRAVVAKYTKSETMKNGAYVNCIEKEDDVLLDFNGNWEILNNKITGGRVVDGKRYEIDGITQTPSTKYIYVDGVTEYVWDKTDSVYKSKSLANDFLDYYYTTAAARYSIPNTELSDPKTRIGIFFYTNNAAEGGEPVWYYFQDVQLTRLYTDGGEVVTIGNIPTSTSVSTTYYYVQPDIGTAAESVSLYTDPTQTGAGEVTPIHNEDSSKVLSISVSNSNCFNILQTIAETFECWIDLEVEREENGAIKIDEEGNPIKWVYLREYIGTDNFAGFKYGINLDTIERTVNSDEIVTKLIVDQAQSDYVDSGVVTIQTANSNPTGESYILNFDYYFNQKLIPNEDECRQDILNNAAEIKQYNNEIKELENKRIDLENALTTINSKRNVFTELIDTAKDTIDKDMALFEKITGIPYEEYQKRSEEELPRYVSSEDTTVNTKKTYYAFHEAVKEYKEIFTAVTEPLMEEPVTIEDVYTLTAEEKEAYNQDKLSILFKGQTRRDFIAEYSVNTDAEDYTISITYQNLNELSLLVSLKVGLIELVPYEVVIEEPEPEVNPSEENWSEYYDNLMENDTIVDIVGEIYTCSSTINNYAGLQANLEKDYKAKRKELYGSETYNFKATRVADTNGTHHIQLTLSDYITPFKFIIGEDTYESSVSKKYFDIVTEETSLEITEIPTDYTISDLDSRIVNFVNDGDIYSYLIEPINVESGVADEIEALQKAKEEVINNFNKKYSRFIQEGTWSATDYIDSELYYLDALQVSHTSAQPQVSYTINVVEISEIEGFEGYNFKVGDKTYIEDTEFFGWAEMEGVLTPAREEVIVSEVEWHLDEPDKNVITIQNYKTRFEDLFQRISATVQTVQYNEATYAKTSSIIDANGTINENVLLASLDNITGKRQQLTSDGSVYINNGAIIIQNLTNSSNLVKIDSEGIRISSDGGATWADAITGKGTNADSLYSGLLNTEEILIGNSEAPTFRWDKAGLSAYRNDKDEYNLRTYVRYDQYGLYGITNGENFVAQDLQDVKDNAFFAVTWDGFFIKNSYEDGGRVSITSDNDFQVIDGMNTERIKIGSLGIDSETGERIYGINISDNTGRSVLNTDNEGNLTVSGTINANAGEFSGHIHVGTDDPYIAIDGVDSSIYSSNYSESTGIGWKIDKDGDAYFNNITARGAIKTAVFEYAEIQAVGGIFIFRPSSTIKEAEVSGNDLILTVEKPLLFKVGQWCKISNYANGEDTEGGEATNPDASNILLTNGLTHVYPVASISGKKVTLTGAKKLLIDTGKTVEELAGGALVDMGDKANGDGEVGTSNYGIGVNSSDNTVNLPRRAISLFETVIDETKNPKVSYKYRGILGTLPSLPSSSVNANIYDNMVGTQGIYTDNMYLGDMNQFIAFYEDANGNKQLKIRANQIVYEVTDPESGQDSWQDVADIAAEGVPGPQGPAGQDAITVKIDSSAGEVFLNKQITTTLTCTVIKGNGTDITNQVTRFNWIKKNADGTVDTSWSRPLAGNTISISEADVTSKAIFICEVEF